MSVRVGARHLIVGIDGADWDVVDAIGPGRLRTLASLRSRGAWARQTSVLPFATLPNWTTFLTGADPGAHGVFDFTQRTGYRVRFTSGAARAIPTWIARLDAMGKTCASLSFPGTYPPERLAHGLAISGWDSPVAFEADRSFVWPVEAFDAITARFGPIRFDEVDEFDTDASRFHDTLGEKLATKVEQRAALYEHLLGERSWDVFACYFGETDTAAHHLFGCFDPRSPRHPEETSRAAADGLPRVYEAIDRALGRLIARAGDDVEITLVSDHGSGASSDKVLYLNRALADAGLLTFHPPAVTARATSAAKELALTLLPPRVKERAFMAMGRALPGWLESRARFSAIDMARTRVFSEELNYFPSLTLNLHGREPRGTVRPSDRVGVRRDLEQLARTLVDPWTGARVIETIHAREDVYFGPHVGRAPDFVVELRVDGAASYNLMPSGGAGSVFRRLAQSEWLGRKGRSLPGSHRPRGIFLASGPSVRACGEVTTHIADASATCLARMGVALPDDAAGRVLGEILVRRAASSEPLPDVVSRSDTSPLDLARTEARLRALGYVD
jgi:predicted AlkP superfamily phosphohydrolase/phosphomutase